MAWINLLEVIYPIGSIYFSALDVSPASSVGGTWNKLTGGLLGLDGSEGVAAAGSNGGSNTITIDQMPEHGHSIVVYDGGLTNSVDNITAGINYTSSVSTHLRVSGQSLAYRTGGGRITYPPTLRFALGEEPLNLFGGVRSCLGLTY